MKPTAVIHGHQHVNKETMLGETRIIGIYGYKRIEIKPLTTAARAIDPLPPSALHPLETLALKTFDAPVN